MQTIQEVTPGIWSWARYDEERQIDFNGHCVVHGGESVLIDPVSLDESVLAELEALSTGPGEPLRAILLTNVHHDRASAELRKRFSIPVYIHEQDAGKLEFAADATFKDGETLFCGLNVIHLPDQKSPGESAFWLADSRTLIVGDALIGRVPGKVNLLPPDKFADIEKARAGLQRLLKVDFDRLLVGDGHSILTHAKTVVAEFLSAQGH